MDSETWDVIVVGAGSAGCVVASRLSEDPQRRVLLIEAGADTGHEPLPDALRSPNYWDFLHSRELQSKYVWPDILARPTDARPAGLYWRGRGLGGSSAVNAMTAIRGVGQSFDLWAATASSAGRRKRSCRVSSASSAISTFPARPITEGKVAFQYTANHLQTGVQWTWPCGRELCPKVGDGAIRRRVWLS